MFAITMSFSSAPAMVSGITSCTGGAVRDNKELNAMIASQTAMGRVGLPDDIGGAIALLLEAENSWVNAQRIEISRGMSLEPNPQASNIAAPSNCFSAERDMA
jgi:hypothetical protein